MIEIAAFMRRVSRVPTGCWEWTGAHSSAGYGQVWVAPQMLYTHRVSYLLHVGPLVDGFDIDHLCRNPGCCNPEHLEQVTHQENIRRGRAAAKTHCQRGHKFTPENTYITPATGHRRCHECRRITQRARYGEIQ